jgi:hypothetical protein
MHTYRQTGDAEWTVGFERTSMLSSWRAIMVFPSEAEAANYAAFLNGGQPAAGRAATRQDEPQLPLEPPQ